jgi:hypothetical protein
MLIYDTQSPSITEIAVDSIPVTGWNSATFESSDLKIFSLSRGKRNISMLKGPWEAQPVHPPLLLEPGDFFLFKIIAKELFRNYMF